jgi:hypothetical protein
VDGAGDAVGNTADALVRRQGLPGLVSEPREPPCHMP